MGFLDTLSKTLSTGVDRAKFEAEKFQRTSRISGDISNVKSQMDTNMRQLGERAFELHQQGRLDAPEIASLTQIVTQLREQQAEKERELGEVQSETFEAWLARQPQPTPETEQQGAPYSDQHTSYGTQTDTSSTVSGGSTFTTSGSNDTSTSVPPFAGATGGQPVAGSTPYACTNCGYELPNNAVFCPNCGTRVGA
jgi:hypothetical protein